MKRFKGNIYLYLMLPAIIILMVVSYVLILYKRSYLVANILNLSIDAIILIYYFAKFCREVSRDTTMTYFRTLLRRKGVKNTEIRSIRSSTFLTKFDTDRGNFFIITSEKGNQILKDIFNDKIFVKEH